MDWISCVAVLGGLGVASPLQQGAEEGARRRGCRWWGGPFFRSASRRGLGSGLTTGSAGGAGIGVVRLDWRHRWFLRSGDNNTLPYTEKDTNSGRARRHRCGFRAPARADRRSAVPGRPRDSARVGVRRCAVLRTARADRRSAFPGGRRHLDEWGSRAVCIFTATGKRSEDDAWPCAKKTMAANLRFDAGVTGGKA